MTEQLSDLRVNIRQAWDRTYYLTPEDREKAEQALNSLVEQLEALQEASIENAEQNAITYRLAHLLGLREEWAGRT